jgi:hypothetical protein
MLVGSSIYLAELSSDLAKLTGSVPNRPAESIKQPSRTSLGLARSTLPRPSPSQPSFNTLILGGLLTRVGHSNPHVLESEGLKFKGFTNFMAQQHTSLTKQDVSSSSSKKPKRNQV